jgi:hypothetical protein
MKAMSCKTRTSVALVALSILLGGALSTASADGPIPQWWTPGSCTWPQVHGDPISRGDTGEVASTDCPDPGVIPDRPPRYPQDPPPDVWPEEIPRDSSDGSSSVWARFVELLAGLPVMQR